MKPMTAKKEGPITKALHEAVAMRKQLIADGMPAAQADATVGQGLKACLGNARPEPWRFYCETCHDTGLEEVVPDVERMRRLYGPDVPNGQPWQPTYRPCEPCAWRSRQRKLRQTEERDDVGTAGRTKAPSRGFSKVGAQ